MEEFEVAWEAEDGYVGGSRPHHFYISADELDEDMSDSDIKNLFWESVQCDFEQKVSPIPEDEDKFVEWAKEHIKSSIELSDLSERIKPECTPERGSSTSVGKSDEESTFRLLRGGGECASDSYVPDD